VLAVEHVSRRNFLATVAVAGPVTFLLASCGGDDGGSSGSSSPADTGADGTVALGPEDVDGELPDTFTVVQRWFPVWLVPGPVRLPVSLADTEGILPTGPETILGRVLDAQTGDVIVTDIVGTRRVIGPGSAPYWTFETTIDEPGIYALQVLGGDVDGAALQVLEPENVVVGKPGEALRPFDTPTVDDGRGVDPLCTLLPEPCPFHEVTLTEALEAGKPVAFLVGTPAHCQTGTCSPALEGLVSLADEYGDRVTMVHAEIFTDDTATTVTPLVQFYAMDFEPALFITDADGVIVSRLDAVFNTDEMRAALDLVV
jgi:hypothetical protein